MARADKSRRTRLTPEERRAQLVRVASRILTEGGADAVNVSVVADAAGVSRPVVYRFFDNRAAIIIAVLEEFTADLTQRFLRQAARTIPGGGADDIARAFVDAVCDAIDAWGAGPWHLLDARGPDPAIAQAAIDITERLIGPWRPRVQEMTGASAEEATTVTHMLVAAGRAALQRWLDGTLSREEAARDTTRGVSGLLAAFTTP